jgi:hypothetical protein
MNLTFKVLSISLFTLATLGSNAFAGSSARCLALFKSPTASTAALDLALRGQKNEQSLFVNLRIYAQVRQTLENNPLIKEALGARTQEVIELLADEKLPVLHEVIESVFSGLENVKARTSAQMLKSIETEMVSAIEDRMPKSIAKERVSNFLAGKVSLKIALGEMTSEEVLQSMLGAKTDIRKISPESLVGRFLKEARSLKGQKISTEIRTFKKGPKSRTKSPERLVIALDPQTFEIYQKYFAGPNFLTHVHAEGQGTLILSHEGQVISYMSPPSELRAPRENTILPPVILATSEAERVNLFFRLFEDDQTREYAKEPWTLEFKKGRKSESYCAAGGYNSCTHWYGNIPMGDKSVSAYTFPGQVDEHAYNAISGKNPEKPQTKPLGKYNNTDNEIVKAVWGEGKSQMQLWQVLGLGAQQRKGELANPGYVAYSVLGSVAPERLPVVFVMQENSVKPILTDLEETISAY